MPLLPVDAAWSPLLETAKVHASGPAAPGGATPLELCWKRISTVRASLAVPAPYNGALTVSFPAGCRKGTLERTPEGTALSLDSSGVYLEALVRIGETPTWTERRGVDEGPVEEGAAPPPLRFAGVDVSLGELALTLGPTPPEDYAGLAALSVDASTLSVVADGVPLLTRDPKEQAAALADGYTAMTVVDVPVPASGRAVYLSVTYAKGPARGGVPQTADDAGFAVLVPQHSYSMRQGDLRRLAPAKTTCVSVDGAPEGAEVRMKFPESLAENAIQLKGDAPREAPYHVTESGRYVARFGPMGTLELHLEPEGCTSTASAR